MFRYFLIRLAKKRNFYLALFFGIAISIMYIVNDVYPYRDVKYGHSVYDIWMGGYTGSIFATLYYLVLPILVVVPMADTYLIDRKNGFYEFIKSRKRKNEFFWGLYLCNFIAGGTVAAVPLMCNIYICFLLIQDKKLDMVVGETHNVTLYGREVLFTTIYFEHPMIHILITIFLIFTIGGVIASLALAFSCLIKNVVLVWISMFIINYLYETIEGIICGNGGATYQLLTYAHQVAPSGKMELLSLLVMLVGGGVGSAIMFYWGVRKYEID